MKYGTMFSKESIPLNPPPLLITFTKKKIFINEYKPFSIQLIVKVKIPFFVN